MIQVTDPNLAWFPGSKKISKYFENIRPKIFRKKLRYAIFSEIFRNLFRNISKITKFEIFRNKFRNISKEIA